MLDFESNEKLLQEYDKAKKNVQNSSRLYYVISRIICIVGKQLKEDMTIFDPQTKKLLPESSLKLGKSDVLLFKEMKYKVNCSLQYDNPL